MGWGGGGRNGVDEEIEIGDRVVFGFGGGFGLVWITQDGEWGMGFGS